MSTKKQTTFYTALAVGSILLVSLLSLTCLTDFPYVHSDESWLAGLTRSMMEEKSSGHHTDGTERTDRILKKKLRKIHQPFGHAPPSISLTPSSDTLMESKFFSIFCKWPLFPFSDTRFPPSALSLGWQALELYGFVIWQEADFFKAPEKVYSLWLFSV